MHFLHNLVTFLHRCRFLYHTDIVGAGTIKLAEHMLTKAQHKSVDIINSA